jgi:hypothetical protein
MFWFAVGVVVGVFLPVHINIMIKDTIKAGIGWLTSLGRKE